MNGCQDRNPICSVCLVRAKWCHIPLCSMQPSCNGKTPSQSHLRDFTRAPSLVTIWVSVYQVGNKLVVGLSANFLLSMLAAQLRATVQGCILVRQCTNFNGSNSPVHGYGTLANGRQFVEK